MFLWIPKDIKRKIFQEMNYQPYDWQEEFHFGYVSRDNYLNLYEQIVNIRNFKGYLIKNEYLIPHNQNLPNLTYPPEEPTDLYVPAQVRGLFTLPRAGKTYSGARETVAHLLLPNLRVWLVSKEYYSAKRGWRMIVQLLRKHFNYLIKSIVMREGDNEYRIELWNGTLLELKSEQNRDRLQTYPVHFMWIDELVSSDVFGQYLLPRIMDTDGIIILTSTLNKDNSDWVRVLLRKLSKNDPLIFRPYFMTDPTRILHFSENIHHLMKVAKELDSFAEITLQSTDRNDLTLPVTDKNIIHDFEYKDDDFIVVGLDWGVNTGIVVVVEREEEGTKKYYVTESYILREFSYDKTIEWLEDKGLDQFPIVIDPSAKQRKYAMERGMSIYEKMLESGLRVYLGSNDIDLGFETMYKAVENEELYFIWETNRYLLEREIPITTKKHLRNFRKKKVHVIDALRYALLWLKGISSYEERKALKNQCSKTLSQRIRYTLQKWGVL